MRAATPADLPRLRELFARANDAPYDLAAVAEEKCFGAGVAGEPDVRVIELGGAIVAASVTCGRYLRILAVHRSHRRKDLGSELLRDAEARGVTIIGAEAGNYFTPGVAKADRGSLAFFRAHGYVEQAETWNLDAPLGALPAPQQPGIRRAARDEADRVLAFVERDFGRIWRFEVAHAFDRDLPTLFVSEEAGEITGFAAHDANNRGLGFFGPTGVTRAARGRGIGCALLLASLADLRRLGYSKAIIPWTDALDFYRKCCGAEPAERFVAFAKPRS